MRYSIRKGSSPVFIKMNNGGWHNLNHENLEVEYHFDRNEFKIYMDLSGNLRTRDKGENIYLDVVDLEKSIDSVDYFQISNEKDLRSIANQLNRVRNESTKLNLQIKIESIHGFEILISRKNQVIVFEKIDLTKI